MIAVIAIAAEVPFIAMPISSLNENTEAAHENEIQDLAVPS